MAQSLRLPDEIEREVRFVEETKPAAIVEATLRGLKRGTAPEWLQAAAGLAVSRSTELPADHHGGPVHPVSGLHAVHAMAKRLGDPWRSIAVTQSVALANRHVHADYMGPAIMPALDPLPVEGEAGRAKLLEAIWNRRPALAERLLLGALAAYPPGEVLDLLLQVAIPRNAIDDHYLLYTVFAARALDDLGWRWAPVLLRPCVRYLATNPLLDTPGRSTAYDDYYLGNLRLYRRFDEIEVLVESRDLLSGRLRLETGGDEAAAVRDLGEAIGALDDYLPISALLAEAMAGGLSLAGAADALSYGAALLNLRSNSGNPFNTHFHTGMNARRYLLGVAGVSLRSKLLALLSWPLGPEVRGMRETMRWPACADADSLRALDGLGAEALIAAMAGIMRTLPTVALDDYPDPNVLVLPDAVRRVMAIAERYAREGHDGEVFFRRLAEITCGDDASEMHAYKLQQAAYEEYHAARPPLRWPHLVAAAKHAACCQALRPQAVYMAARRCLKAS